MTDDLVKRLRLWGEHGLTNTLSDLVKAADRIEAQAAEIERLNHANQELQSENARMREAGTKLAGYAGHDDNCEIMLKGVWSDPIPCTCGYEDAWKAWAALGDGNEEVH
jgi:hypothetical protein